MKKSLPVLFVLSLLGFSAVSGTASAADCAGLTALNLPHVKITSATSIASGSFTEPPRSHNRPGRHYPEAPVFCQVQGVSTPVAGSRIGFEVWLPQPASWSHRLHMVGNGAFGSNLYYAQLVARVQHGDVAVATDTGHTGGDLTFGKNPEAIIDWGGGRAVHESVVAAKAVIKAYYGMAQKYAYFTGSSTGGHEGLMAAQRHPEDFNGIIAGAPGNHRTALSMSFLWEFVHNHPPGDNDHQIVPNAKLAMVNAAVVKACDGVDGVTDGVISDPRECHFNVASLQCPDVEKPDCLTAPQVATMQAIYAGPRDARTGKQIFPGMTFGSEGIPGDVGDEAYPGWSDFWADPDHPTLPQRADLFRIWVFHDPDWNWWKFDWGKDVDTVTAVMGPVIDAVDPDLSKFRKHGGKLIMFIGWQDPVGSAHEAINYYDSVVARGAGASDAAKLRDTQKFARLYMIAGMGHTAGGPGATNVSNATRDSAPPVADAKHDMGVALYDWVEKGIAPNDLIATHYSKGSGPSGTVQFQRPICVWPKVPRYKGGDQNSAASFACRLPDTKH